MRSISVDEESILSVINCLDVNKAAGLDRIPSIVPKIKFPLSWRMCNPFRKGQPIKSTELTTNCNYIYSLKALGKGDQRSTHA